MITTSNLRVPAGARSNRKAQPDASSSDSAFLLPTPKLVANGARTLRSIGHIARMQQLRDNDHELVAPPQMLGELTVDNAALARSLEEAHDLCEQQRDVATASLIEGWIDEAQNSVWFLREANGASGEL